MIGAAREPCQHPPVLASWRAMRSIPVAALAVLACLVLAVAACGSAAGTPAPGGSQALASPGGPAPAPAVTPTPATRSPSPRPSPSQKLVVPHDDPELEKLLPDKVDGKTLMKISVGPVSSVGVSGAQGIKDAAKLIGDGSGNFGLAYAGDPDGKFNLFTLHINGAKPGPLLTIFTQMTLAETPGGKAESATLGGRSLVHVIDPTSQIGDVWFYAIGDTLYGVQAGSPEQATKLLAMLPQK
jgi:hypothetical protein